MAHPRVPWTQIRAGLVARTRGATVAEAAAIAGCSERVLYRRLAEEPVVVVRERRQRPGALGLEERFEIQVGIRVGETDAAIARRIGRHRGTVGREIAAAGGRRRYNAARAHERAAEAARRPKARWFETNPVLWDRVVELLGDSTWSPKAIARHLHHQHPEEPECWVSHEAIYQAIYVQARGSMKKELTRYLRSGRVTRKPRGRVRATGSRIVGMVNISERPAEAADRAVPGHWEGDLIIGADQASAIATLIERTSRYGLLVKVASKNADHVAQRLAKHLSILPTHLARSLTWDQGSELAAHQRFSVATGIPVYFCDPRSPWQRPSNENFNRDVRWFVGRGDLSVYSQRQLDTFAMKINGRPRGILDWQTAAERFAELVAATA